MADTLRIATFNLESLDLRAGDDGFFAERVAVLRPQLLRLDADILCLQEINGQRLAPGAPRTLEALRRLLAETPYADMACVATENPPAAKTAARHSGVQQAHNLVILSRFPVRASRQIRHHRVRPPRHRLATAGPDSAELAIEWDRPVLHAEIDIGRAAPLHVLNVHLRAPLASPIPGGKQGPFTWKHTGAWAEGFFIAAVKRAGQALEARLAVDALFDADPAAWIAVCGDCNAELRQTATRLLMADAADTGDAALAPRSLAPVESAIPAERRYTVIHAGARIMLDHLLVSRGLMDGFRAAAIHNETLGDEAVDHAAGKVSPETHHAPIVAEFALPG